MIASLFALSLAATSTVGPVATDVPVASKQAHEADPAILINRAFTHARNGRDDKARALFETVRQMKVDYTLETKDGRWVYPADLARQGLRQLNRGELHTQTFASRR